MPRSKFVIKKPLISFGESVLSSANVLLHLLPFRSAFSDKI